MAVFSQSDSIRPGPAGQAAATRAAGSSQLLLYLRPMRRLTRIRLLLTLLVAVSACGKSAEKQIRDTARTLANADLPRQDIEVLDVRESGGFTIAEIKVKTALKFKKSGDELVLEEIRIGDRRWEKAAHLLRAIDEERSQTTHQLLEKIRTAVRAYQEDHGSMPAADDFESLIDLLSPNYLNPPVRLDGWSTPFVYERLPSGTFDLRSAGPDRQMGNADDIVVR